LELLRTDVVRATVLRRHHLADAIGFDVLRRHCLLAWLELCRLRRPRAVRVRRQSNHVLRHERVFAVAGMLARVRRAAVLGNDLRIPAIAVRRQHVACAHWRTVLWLKLLLPGRHMRDVREPRHVRARPHSHTDMLRRRSVRRRPGMSAMQRTTAVHACWAKCARQLRTELCTVGLYLL